MHRIATSLTRAARRISTSTKPLFTTPRAAPTPTRSFTTTTPTVKMSAPAALSADSLLELIKNRRSYYPLTKDVPLSNARIQEIFEQAVQHVPSSFNSQSNRAVILFGAEHDKLWDMTADVLAAIVPPENWAPTAAKMAMFKAAAGTILFFEDQEVVQGMQARFASYADK